MEATALEMIMDASVWVFWAVVFLFGVFAMVAADKLLDVQMAYRRFWIVFVGLVTMAGLYLLAWILL